MCRLVGKQFCLKVESAKSGLVTLNRFPFPITHFPEECSANLWLTNLQSLRTLEDGNRGNQQGVFAANGINKKRLRKALTRSGSGCQCRNRCWRHVAFNLILRICIAFWSLSKGAQDALLWSIQNSSLDNLRGDDDEEFPDVALQGGSVRVHWHVQGESLNFFFAIFVVTLTQR